MKELKLASVFRHSIVLQLRLFRGALVVKSGSLESKFEGYTIIQQWESGRRWSSSWFTLSARLHTSPAEMEFVKRHRVTTVGCLVFQKKSISQTICVKVYETFL